MEERLIEAALKGDVNSLHQVMDEDGLILDKILMGCFKKNPLHVAISRNEIAFVQKLLSHKKELAEVLDSGHSALHLASAKGHLEIVEALIHASRDMCLARDPNGKNPVHIAAIKGKVDVLKALVEASPNAARAKLDGNETILHLCVKHGQLEALKVLLKMSIGSEFVNAKDRCGNTILHLAVCGKQDEIIKHVTNYDNPDSQKRKKLEVNATNAEGHTAMDIVLLEINKNEADTRMDTIARFLRKAKCKRARDVVQRDWLSKKRDTLMVVASLIATMAFQAAVSPPGGVWQDNSNEYRAGEAVMAYNYPDSYPYFLRANTIAFVASLSTILLLISDLPFKNRAYMWCLVVIMWLTITSTAFTYGFSITVVTPKKDRGSLSNTIMVGVIAWCSVMAILLLVHTSNLLIDWWSEYQSNYKARRDIYLFGLGGKHKATDEYTATSQGNRNQQQGQNQV